MTAGAGRSLRVLREFARLDRSDVAARAGLSRDFLCDVEEGRQRPAKDVYGRVARVIGEALADADGAAQGGV